MDLVGYKKAHKQVDFFAALLIRDYERAGGKGRSSCDTYDDNRGGLSFTISFGRLE